ncbi:HMCN [Mytilus coruscus]|uniref:HMCN n=1 Tax=Mytilus coruscus TaxID=42192 RepID=A0A6J8D7M7_MYTCO|nr:HMCN [Mytilus coruscus]
MEYLVVQSKHHRSQFSTRHHLNRGTHICYVKNDIGTGHSIPIYVTITGDVPIVFVGDRNYSIGYGDEITLFCNITSDPPANNVYWEKVVHGTKNILNNWTVGIQGVSVDTPSLTIMESTTADIGTYRCVAINDVGTGYSETILLDVFGELPTVTIAADLLEIKYGETLQIVCVINAKPPPTKVYWEKVSNGITKVISNGTSGTDGITIDNPSITLLHATDSDSGFYKCFAVNEFGMGYSSPTKLTVIGGLPEVSVPYMTYLTGTGYTIALTCVINNAFPAVSKVYWERYISGSTTIISSASIGLKGVTVEEPSLIIPSATEMMSGEYTCFAVNSVGTGSSLPVQLTVQAGFTQKAPIKEYAEKQDHSPAGIIIVAVSAASTVGTIGLFVIACLKYRLTRRTGKKDMTTANNIRLEQNDSSTNSLQHSGSQIEKED